MSTHLLLINPLLANLTHYNESGWPVWLIIILQFTRPMGDLEFFRLISRVYIASLHTQNPLLKPCPLWLCRPLGQWTTFPGHAFIGCIGHCRLDNTLRHDMEISEVLTCNSTLIPTPSMTVTLRTPVPTYSLRGIRLVTLHYSMATTAVSVMYFNGDR